MMNTQIGRNWSYFQIILLAVNIFMKVNATLWVGALKISHNCLIYPRIYPSAYPVPL